MSLAFAEAYAASPGVLARDGNRCAGHAFETVRPVDVSECDPTGGCRIHSRQSGRSIGVIPLSVYMYVELFSAAALAVWVMARFPRRGPRSIMSAAGLVVVALALGRLAPAAIRVVVGAPFGIYVALLGCVLPLFFSIFLTTGWLMRAFLGHLGGSGGAGHRIGA
jgi:hypothetical protein